ncbi:MAG: hypothetical protein ACK44A_13855, partial [Roseateles sp.]
VQRQAAGLADEPGLGGGGAVSAVKGEVRPQSATAADIGARRTPSGQETRKNYAAAPRVNR